MGWLLALAMAAGTANAARVEYIFTADDAVNVLRPCNGIMPESADVTSDAIFKDGLLQSYVLDMDPLGFDDIHVEATEGVQGFFQDGVGNITYSPILMLTGNDTDGYDLVIQQEQWTFALSCLEHGRWLSLPEPSGCGSCSYYFQ